MVIRKIARIARAASTDAELARRTAHSPAFHRDVAKDRRGALSAYKTVQHALRDRERLAASEAAKTSTTSRRKAKGR